MSFRIPQYDRTFYYHGTIMEKRVNIDEPRYDQNTYKGRVQHFFTVTNPLNLFVSNQKLEWSKELIQRYRSKHFLPPETTEEDLWRAKALYDSAFHPDTGEKMNLIGRMSAQVPMNMLITGGMLAFYRSVPAVVFWQWTNQSFNALVNYTNRNAKTESSNEQLLVSYVSASTGAVATALFLNKIFDVKKNKHSLIGKLVPWSAVAAANCINIPLMRVTELQQGIPVMDENGTVHGQSKIAAKIGIASVVFSRVLMATPGMTLVPLVMSRLEHSRFLCRYPYMNLPIQIGLLGVCLTFATPMCCALFRQQAMIAVDDLEDELREKIAKLKDPPKYLYYNKGL